MGRSSNDDRSDRFNPNNDAYAAAEANEAAQRDDDWDDEDVGRRVKRQPVPRPSGQSLAVAITHKNYELPAPLALDRISHIFALARAALAAQDHEVAKPEDLSARDAKVRDLAGVAQDLVAAIAKKRYDPDAERNRKRCRAGSGEWFLTHESLDDDHSYYALEGDYQYYGENDDEDYEEPGEYDPNRIDHGDTKTEKVRRKTEIAEEQIQYQRFLQTIVDPEQQGRAQGLVYGRGEWWRKDGDPECGLVNEDQLSAVGAVEAPGSELRKAVIAGLRSLLQVARGGKSLEGNWLIVPRACSADRRRSYGEAEWIQTEVPQLVVQPEGSSDYESSVRRDVDSPGWYYQRIGPVRTKFSEIGWDQVENALSAIEYLAAQYPPMWYAEGLMEALQHAFSSVEWAGADFCAVGLKLTTSGTTPSLELRWFGAGSAEEAGWLTDSLVRDGYRAVALPVVSTER